MCWSKLLEVSVNCSIALSRGEEVRFDRKTFPAVATWQPPTITWVSWRSEARSPLTRPVAKAKVEAKARLKAKLRAREGNKAMELVKAQVSPFSTLPHTLLPQLPLTACNLSDHIPKMF